MIQEQEDRKRRQKLEDERTIRENSLVELRNRSVTSEEELARARDLRERETHKQRKTLFDRESVDYDANALVRERARNEGLIRGGFRERREGLIRDLNDPAFLPIREYILDSRDNEDEFQKRLAEKQADIDNIRKQIEEGRIRASTRLAYAQKGPMPWETAANMTILERIKEDQERVRAAKAANAERRAGLSLGGIGALSSLFFGGDMENETPDPELSRQPMYRLPLGITRPEQVRQDLTRAQAEKARREPTNPYADTQEARIEQRRNEKIAETLKALNNGANPNVVISQLIALEVDLDTATKMVSKAME
jgi:hypothetical protein